jgi:hypothetical protein
MRLPDKHIWQAKLNEFYQLAQGALAEDEATKPPHGKAVKPRTSKKE